MSVKITQEAETDLNGLYHTDLGKETGREPTEGEVLSVYAAMQQLKDRRGKRGRRYSLALLLTYLLLAKAAGETTLQAITEWIRLRAAWLPQVLPEVGPTFPCAATYSNVLRAVEPEQVNELLMALLTRVRAENCEQGEQCHVVLDGKTLRGTRSTWLLINQRCIR